MRNIYLAILPAILSANAVLAQIPTDYAWAKKPGGTGTEEGKCIAADEKGNVVVGGYYKNTATFGTLPTITAVANHDAIFGAPVILARMRSANLRNLFFVIN